MESFDHKVVVVTGGASGIGLGLARQLSAAGARVVVGDVDATALQGLGAAVPDAVGVVTDVSDAASVQNLRDVALDRFGTVDLICANAGITGPTGRRMWELDRSEWDAVIGVNLVGTINTIRTFVPHLVDRGTGHVLITASMAGLSRAPVLPAYWATKHAVVALGESLSSQLADAAPDVGVTILAPGRVHSALGRALPAEGQGHPSADVPGVSNRIIEADECARITIDAILENRLYAVTHPEAVSRVRARFEPIVQAFTDAESTLEAYS